jgi:hypothetical protein
VAEEQVQAPAQTNELTQHEAVAALSQVLEKQEKPEQERARDPQGKFAKPETKDEAPAEETKTEEAPQEDQAEIKPEPRKFKLKYKGEEREVDENETIELAQKGWDYTQKTQQLSKEREESASKLKAEQEAVRKQYEDQLELYRKATLRLADQEALSADLGKLAIEDPAKAQQLFFKRQQIAETLQAIGAEQQKIAQQRQAEMQESFKKQAQQAVERLQEKIPGWNNDLYGKILKGAAESYGFEQKEVNAINDHRAIEVLHDALKWREYQSAKPKTVEKKVPPVAPKVQKPGSGEKPESGDGLKKSVTQFNKTGSRSDAQDVIRQMIESGRL